MHGNELSSVVIELNNIIDVNDDVCCICLDELHLDDFVTMKCCKKQIHSLCLFSFLMSKTPLNPLILQDHCMLCRTNFSFKELFEIEDLDSLFKQYIRQLNKYKKHHHSHRNFVAIGMSDTAHYVEPNREYIFNYIKDTYLGKSPIEITLGFSNKCLVLFMLVIFLVFGILLTGLIVSFSKK